MNRYQKGYLQAFIGSLLICWSPSNALAYLAPVLALAWFILATRSRLVVRNLIVWLFVWVFSIFLHAPFVHRFAFHSAFLSILTYSAFALVAVIPTRFLGSPILFERMLRWVRWVVLIEAILGIVQACYGALMTGGFDISNGDFVEGTIHPSLAAELAFSNPMFATNMALLLIVLLPSVVLEKKGRLPFLVGAVALILASVVHVLLLLAVSFVIALFIYKPLLLRSRAGCLVVVALFSLGVLAFFILRSNFGTLYGFARQILQGQSYRSQVVMRALLDMPSEYPFMPIAGLGPGQFSSRAGLIGTGLYFGGPANPRPVPFLPQGMSRAFRDYVLDIWLEMSSTGYSYGSTHKPYLSWLSVYVEMGAPLLIAIFVFVGIALVRLRAKARSYPKKVTATCLGAGMLLVLFLGIQENYWEVPQATFVGLMLLKVLYANMVCASHSPGHGRAT